MAMRETEGWGKDREKQKKDRIIKRDTERKDRIMKREIKEIE